MTQYTALEIQIHLEDGRVTKFIQDDGVTAQGILDAIVPNRLFSSPQLLIGSDHTLTAFQPRRIIQVDILTDLVPSWPFTSEALNTRVINENEFIARNQPLQDVHQMPDREIVVFGVWEMVDGSRIYLQTHMTGFEDRQLPVEISMYLQKVMTSGGLLVRGRTRGYVILNPASLLRFTTYLGLHELPTNALPMIRLGD